MLSFFSPCSKCTSQLLLFPISACNFYKDNYLKCIIAFPNQFASQQYFLAPALYCILLLLSNSQLFFLYRASGGSRLFICIGTGRTSLDTTDGFRLSHSWVCFLGPVCEWAICWTDAYFSEQQVFELERLILYFISPVLEENGREWLTSDSSFEHGVLLYQLCCLSKVLKAKGMERSCF